MAKLFEPPQYIAVEGPIRVGKSTLANIIADRLNAQRVIEPEDNPFLRAFYEGERGAGFQAQFAFLVRRFEQLRALEVGPKSRKTVVADYIFEKDKIFAYINLSDPELEVYNRYYQLFREQLPAPDLVIYLQASPDVLKKRLRKKNVAGETAVSDDYIEEVVKAYEHFFFHYTSSDLLVVNTNDIDFVERHTDLQELLRRVSEPIRGTQYFCRWGRRAQPACRSRRGFWCADRGRIASRLMNHSVRAPLSNLPFLAAVRANEKSTLRQEAPHSLRAPLVEKTTASDSE